MSTARVTYDGGQVGFTCPGCNHQHLLSVDPAHTPAWEFNGNVELPTLKPSILMRTGHFINPDTCWCRFNDKRVADGKKPACSACVRCHSFVTDGRIQFLDDCSHALAGQTVDLPGIAV